MLDRNFDMREISIFRRVQLIITSHNPGERRHIVIIISASHEKYILKTEHNHNFLALTETLRKYQNLNK